MKTIKERVQGFCKRCRTTQPYCPCTPKEQQNCMIYDAYIKGATEQQELDNKQLCEMVLDNQNAIIDKACEWIEQHSFTMYNAGKKRYGVNLEQFRKAMKGGNDG